MTKSFKPLHCKLFGSSALVALAVCANPSIVSAQENNVLATQTDASASTDSNHFGEDKYEIRFRADTLIVTPVMSVGLVDGVRTVVRGEAARFQTYNNYPSFVERGEIRVFAAGASPDSEPLAVIETDKFGGATWHKASNG